MRESKSGFSVSDSKGMIPVKNCCNFSVWDMQFGTNNTQNVANLGDNWRKIRLRHLVPNEP